MAPLAVAFLVALAGPAAAQPLGLPALPGGLPQLPGAPLRDLGQTTGGLVAPVELATALQPTRVLGRDLLRRNPRLIEADEAGRPVVRGVVTAIGIDDVALAQAQAEGFQLRSRERLEALDLDMAVLAAPKAMTAVEAVRRLRALDPAGQYDFDHLYFESGGLARPSSLALALASGSRPGSGEGLRIGLVDGSVAPRAPSLARAQLVQRAFAPGGAKVSAHATAIASLLAGEDGAFRGAAPGATLYVADVYGGTPAGGSAASIARGLAWLAEARVPVINVSLVGPPNALLAAAVQRLTARGHVVVAAVGNDGPAAPPLYPAAYPEVVGVTGVDDRRRVLPEAGRGPQVDFAAPGAGLAAAAPSGGYSAVRGTSFAAPWVAGLLARRLTAIDPGAAQRAVAALASEAVDLGAPGPDTTFGLGAVALGLPARPSAVAARAP